MRNFLNLRRLIVAFSLVCVGCGTAVPSVKPFKLDVQQGNVVTSKMLLQLRPGMTKSQVRFIMGSPLIQDSFHGNRWDYAYQLRENGTLKEQRRVILDFENDVLKAVRGDVVPAGSDAAKALRAEAEAEAAALVVTKEAQEKSMIEKLKFWDKSADTKPSAVNAAQQNLADGLTTTPQIAPEALPANQQDQAIETSKPQATSVPNTSLESVNIATEATIEDLPSVIATPLVVDSPATRAPDVGQASVSESVTIQSGLVDQEMQVAMPLSVEAIPESGLSGEVQSETLVEDGREPIAVAPMNASAEDAAITQTIDPEDSAGYQSTAGMIFDRELKMIPLDDAARAKQLMLDELSQKTQPTERAIAPEPRPAATESESGFFDQMLERIGF